MEFGTSGQTYIFKTEFYGFGVGLFEKGSHMCAIKRPAQQYRLVVEVKEEPHGNGGCTTEKFTIADNSHISWTTFKRKIRIIPIIPRSSALVIYLRDSETGKVQKKSMPSHNGKIVVRKNNTGSAVIHRGGTYYLDIRWGSLVRRLEVRLEEPVS